MSTNQPDADLVSREMLAYLATGHRHVMPPIYREDDCLPCREAFEKADAILAHLAPYIAEREAAALEAAAVKLTDEADLLFTMAKQMGLPWTDARQAKASGYRESANLVRAAQHRSKP